MIVEKPGYKRILEEDSMEIKERHHWEELSQFAPPSSLPLLRIEQDFHKMSYLGDAKKVDKWDKLPKKGVGQLEKEKM